MRGPIDYIIVGFEGNKFDGSILRALAAALDKGIIALVSLSFISKDNEGNVDAFDVAAQGDEFAMEFVSRYKPSNDSVDQDDLDEMADLINENCSAGLLVIEHLWAKPLKEAIINAGGYLIADGRIHPDAVNELENKEE